MGVVWCWHATRGPEQSRKGQKAEKNCECSSRDHCWQICDGGSGVCVISASVPFWPITTLLTTLYSLADKEARESTWCYRKTRRAALLN